MIKEFGLNPTGDNAMGTIPNCLLLHANQIRFVAPSPASKFFEQAIGSVDEEELNRALLKKHEQRDGLSPVVTNVYDQRYTTTELFLKTRRNCSIEQPMRHLKSKIKIRPVFLHIEERIRGLALITLIALMAYCILEHLAKQNLNPKATTH
ncbi:MAG TPA: hypothetical protein VLH18_06540 [Candidatus Limnocylindrales bacterium]|nr:hypothetical protein [Candidatus Limnocylindrales bacterium]